LRGFFICKGFMKNKQYNFEFEVYDSIEDIQKDDAALLQKAREATNKAYAPYSNFFVGAAAKLKDGTIVTGANQENASFPVGICAERVLLSSVSSQHPSESIETIAVSYDNRNGESNKPVSPCGMCRQTLFEYEQRQQKSIRLILGGMEGEVYVIEKAGMLLPLSFTKEDIE
jgi:cytidine deaminase